MTPTTVAVGQHTCSFDHHDPALAGDAKYDRYAELRSARVQRSDQHDGFWILTHAADIEAALLDWQTYSSQVNGVFQPPSPEDLTLVGLEHDGEVHAIYRRLYAKAVGRPTIGSLIPKIRAVVSDHIGELAAEGGGDWVSRVGSTVPVEVIAMAVGLPEEPARRIRQIAEEQWAVINTDPNAFAPMVEMLAGELASRRENPRDDFLTSIQHERVRGRTIEFGEVIAILNGLIIAGHETTMNASANLALRIASDPELRLRMRGEPKLQACVVEESLRHDTPVQGFFRTLTRDVTIDDTPMSAGDRVLLIYGSANRDSTRFADADDFCPERSDLSKHFSFGWGRHRCIGAQLAQTELRIMAEVLCEYDVAVVGDPQPAAPTAVGAFSGLRRLDLKFEKVATDC